MRWLVGIALVLSCFAPSRATSDSSRLPDRWVQLDAPIPEEIIEHAPPLLLVRGRAVERAPGRRTQLVIALDQSESSFRPSGYDLDADTRTASDATPRPVHRALRSPQSSLAHVGLHLARRLVRRLDARWVRVGVLTFDSQTRLISRLSAPAVTLDALSGLRLFRRRNGTHLARAIHRSSSLLDRTASTDDAAEFESERAILLITDGYPTAPGTLESARRYARRAAVAAKRRGIRIFGLAPGSPQRLAKHPEELETLIEITRTTGGSLFRSQIADDWIEHLVPTRALAIRGVEIENLDTGKRGRAVRWFEDGSFDGFVSLRQGRNHLRTEIQLNDGATISREFQIHYRGAQPPRSARSSERFLEELRARTLETRLARRAKQGAAPRRTAAPTRTVEIEAQAYEPSSAPDTDDP